MNIAASKKPSVLAFFLATWGGVYDALTRLFPLAAVTFAILLALAVAKVRVMSATTPTVAFELERLSYEALRASAAAPWLFAIYRVTVLDEPPVRYRAATVVPAFGRFFGLSLAYAALMNATITVSNLLPGSGALLGAVIVLAPLPVYFSAMVLFPAVAVGAPGAGWRWAVATARGHWGRMFLISLVTLLPFFVVAAAAIQILHNTIGSDTAIAPAMFEATAFFLVSTVGAVLASLVYQWIGKEKGLERIPGVFE